MASMPGDNPSDPSDPSEDDPQYFQVFLDEMSKGFPYVNLFPWAPAKIFDTSKYNPALRQSLLSVAALLSQNDRGKGRDKALDHLHNALMILQDRISMSKIDEGLVISSFLLAQFSIMSGDHKTARTHLGGMVVVLKQLSDGEGTSRDRDSVVSPTKIDPLTMLIWRMAKRIDYITSIASAEAPVLPRYFPHSPPQLS
jgi:hypothetical protein